MAGLSQGGGVGLSLANWMIDGDPNDDIWAMDVARYGDWATLAYTNAKVRENYSRRFRITFPNEELPAGRPLHTTPIYARLTEHNAVWGAGFGLEHPLWFQRSGLEPVEDVTFHRSNAFECVGEESRAVRERVGLSEAPTSPSTGQRRGRRRLAAGTVHQHGCRRSAARNLTAMLNPQGRIVGEFSVSRIGDDEFFLFGSQAAEVHHSRWFLDHLPSRQPDPLRGDRACRWSASRSPGRSPATCCSQLTRTLTGDRRLPVHGIPTGRDRHGAGVAVADDLHR